MPEPSLRRLTAAAAAARRTWLGAAVAGALVAPALHAQTASHHAAPDTIAPAERIPAHERFMLESAATGETRTISVYLPPQYDRTRAAGYPVVWLLDGGVKEDFPHVVVAIDSLITLGRIPPMIVVGVENTERRRDMTGPTTVAKDSTIAPRVGGSAAFRGFLRDELVPAVRARYHTTDDGVLMGESLAGLFVMETALTEPRLFPRYVAISPSLWWNDGALVKAAAQGAGALAGTGVTLYLTAANEPGIAAESAALAESLRAAAPAGVTFHYTPRPELEHHTIYRATFPAALVTLYGR